LYNPAGLTSLAPLWKEERRSVEEEGGGAGGRCRDGALYACGFGTGLRAG